MAVLPIKSSKKTVPSSWTVTNWPSPPFAVAKLPTNVPPFGPPIHVEIQLTAWLVDGGLPLVVLYGGAIAAAMLALWRRATVGTGLGTYAAAVVLCLNLFMVGQSFAGPTFNSLGGIQFWLLTSALLSVRRPIPRSHDG